MKIKKIFTILVVSLVSITFSEILVRVGTLNMKNYEIEMWRYAKELKIRSENLELNHEHKKSSKSILQGVEIRINKDGFRGENLDYQKFKRKIYFLGGSMLLGWGLAEDEIATTLIQKQLPSDAVVINGGVGNYNAKRYTAQFFDNVERIGPTDVYVLYYLRDAEKLDSGSDSYLIKSSQLATLTYSAYKKIIALLRNTSLDKHYDEVYSEYSEGYISMKNSLVSIKNYTQKHKIKFKIFLIPDFNNLSDYKFIKQRNQMLDFCKENGISCVDLLPGFENDKNNDFRVMRGDPHPNGKANKIIADMILKNIN